MFLQSFLDSIISKILSFLHALLSVRRPSRKISTIPIYHDNLRKGFNLKDTTKDFIKTMKIKNAKDVKFPWKCLTLPLVI